MPSAHCDSNGNSGSGDQMPDLDGVHDLDDVGSLLEHNSIDCGQPMLMPFQLTTATHTTPQYRENAPHRSFSLTHSLSLSSQLCSIKNRMRLNETLFTFVLGNFFLMVLLTFILFSANNVHFFRF